MQALTVGIEPPHVAPASPSGRARRPRCRRRSRLRRSLPWCRCSARLRAATPARCASAGGCHLDERRGGRSGSARRLMIESAWLAAVPCRKATCPDIGARGCPRIPTPLRPMGLRPSCTARPRTSPGAARRPARFHRRSRPGATSSRRRALPPRPLAADRATAASPARSPAPRRRATTGAGTTTRGRLLLPGFIDTHVHSPQLDVIASYGTELLDWLDTLHLPGRDALRRRGDARGGRGAFPRCAAGARHHQRRWCSRPCTRSVPTRCSRRPQARGMRIVAGKVLMDRHAPPACATTSRRPSATAAS